MIVASIFREDGWGREAFFGGIAAKVFFARDIDVRPVTWTHADVAAWAYTFDDKVGLEFDLDTAAAERDVTFGFHDIKDGAFTGHVSRAVGAVRVLEVTLHCVHQGGGILLKICVE